ncbi:Hydra magnipapillata [Seminavis robusta]|uniref:Hydra magnipapillata n=1 Tax=Seminavis robusta TaxID=568900 RepID=A0A9N8DED9_9STRA|nr:Hydra magnipapillata [Seminavis robusta]|eukprot:Sro32_g021060.1 Hydra magnipapillata (448) ;mRNA; f:145932-147275
MTSNTTTTSTSSTRTKDGDCRQSQLAADLKAKGRQCFAAGKYDEALKQYNRALTVIKASTTNESSALVADLHGDMAACHEHQGDTPKAVELLKKRIALETKLFGNESLEVAQTHQRIGDLLRNSGKYPAAISRLKSALQILTTMESSNPVQIAQVDYRLGVCYQNLPDDNQNVTLFHLTRAMDTLEHEANQKEPLVLLDATHCSNALARIMQDEKKIYKKAIDYHKTTLSLAEQCTGLETEEQTETVKSLIVSSHVNIPLCRQEQGKYDKALKLHKKALGILINIHGYHHTETASCLTNIAICYEKQGQPKDALRYYTQAETSLLQSSSEQVQAQTRQLYVKLWRFHQAQKNPIKAQEYYDKAQRVASALAGDEWQAVTSQQVAHCVELKTGLVSTAGGNCGGTPDKLTSHTSRKLDRRHRPRNRSKSPARHSPVVTGKSIRRTVAA